MTNDDLHRTNINLYARDVVYLQKHYGRGWTERVREMIHTAVEHRKTIRHIPVDQRGQVVGEIRSAPLRSLHEVAKDLHAVGAIDKATMRDFDLSCLTPVEPPSPKVKGEISRRYVDNTEVPDDV